MTNSWPSEVIIDFIHEIRKRPVLWNINSEVFKDKIAKKRAWADVAAKFDITSEEAYKKYRSLRTYAKNEEKKKERSGGDKTVSWFAYDAISFILTGETSNAGNDSENASDADNSVENEATCYVKVESDDPLLFLDSSYPRDSASKKFKSSLIRKNRSMSSGKRKEEETHCIPTKRNKYAGFGEHVATKLNSYDSYTRSQAEFKIMQILYECDMGIYRNGAPSTDTQSPDR